VPTAIAIWTTTPWTLPRTAPWPSTAVRLFAVEFNWRGVEALLLATELVKTVMHTLGAPRWTVIAERRRGAGEARAAASFNDRQVP